MSTADLIITPSVVRQPLPAMSRWPLLSQVRHARFAKPSLEIQVPVHVSERGFCSVPESAKDLLSFFDLKRSFVQRSHRVGVRKRPEVVSDGGIVGDVERSQEHRGDEARPIPSCRAVEENRSIIGISDRVEYKRESAWKRLEVSEIVEGRAPPPILFILRPKGRLIAAVKIYVDVLDRRGDSSGPSSDRRRSITVRTPWE